MPNLTAMPNLNAPIHPAAGDGHDHPADLETCLALVNTVELTDGVPGDSLPTASDALSWLVEHGLGHENQLAEQARRDGDAWLARVHEVRGALRATWDAVVDGRPIEPPALAMLNGVLTAAPIPELVGAGPTVMVGHRHREEDPAGEALARLVAPLVDAIAAGQTNRFRVCANDGCRWVFEDTSRSGRRRWCDMTTCGNRAKVRRFRSRRREGRDGADEGSAAVDA
jgi:predicted RNA-binding Zn ribbon-like protein